MANMDFYGMFDFASGDTDVYQYSADEFSALIAALTCNGVSFNYGNKFNAAYSGLNVTLQSGAVFINGRYGFNSTAKVIALDAVSSATTKKIVAELNTTTRTIEIKAIDDGDLTSNQVGLFTVAVDTSGVTAVTDIRNYCYAGQTTPSAQIIYSATQPTVVNGAVWLKPVDA